MDKYLAAWVSCWSRSLINGNGPRSASNLGQPSVISFFVPLLVGYLMKTQMCQMNTPTYAIALRNTTVNHIRGCIVATLYPTLPLVQSKMVLLWDIGQLLKCLSHVITCLSLRFYSCAARQWNICYGGANTWCAGTTSKR